MTLRLSESLEDYLEAIAELIVVNGHAHTKEIAEKLDVKMPSVTAALRQLDKMGCIVYNTHYPVQLTPAGKEIADQVVRRHRILKKFFGEILGLHPEKASETACRLEHAVDEETIERFILFSEAIENRSDARALQTYLTEAIAILSEETFRQVCVLSEMHSGETGTVRQIGRNVPPEEIPGLGIAAGDQITVQGASLDKTSFRITVRGQALNLPLKAAENIWIDRDDNNSL
ncbi:MAG: metal-dependent transcriptional regulator [Lentisphaeria bacterium]|nr:metal-dependent transcriptional regulator [Lentisphaeria bacterium]